MPEFVYNQFCTIFGSGLIEKTSKFMDMVIAALNSIFPADGSGFMNTACTLFGALAGSLLVIYYFMDLYTLAAKDIISLDKLVVSFIKLLVCFTLVMYCKEITVNTFNLCGNIYHGVAEKTVNTVVSTDNTSSDNTKTDKKTTKTNSNSVITFWGMDTLPGYEDPIDIKVKYVIHTQVGQATGQPEDKDEEGTLEAKSMKDVFETATSKGGLYGKGVKGTINSLSSFMLLLLPWLVSYVAVGLAYLVSISNAIMLLGYGFFMPIALTQCMDAGQRSAGILYLKKFIAQALSFAVIVVILYGVSKLQGALLPQILQNMTDGKGTLDINSTNFKTIISNFPVLISIVIVQFGAVGAMLKGTQIANDAIGAR